VRNTIKHILAEYGTIALVVYFAIFFLALGGFWMAIRFGWRSQSTAAGVGTFAAAYIATKLTQPLRIAVTAVLTPVIGRLYERVRPGARRAPAASASTENPPRA
jgi:O-antigen ligase